MQFKTAIILSVIAAASTFAAPIHSYESGLSRRENYDTTHQYYARDFEDVQEIEARSPYPEEQVLEARSPLKINVGAMRSQLKGMKSSFKGASGLQRYGSLLGPKGKNLLRQYRAANAKATAMYSGRTRHPRSLPEDVQELEARSPFPDEQELDARSPFHEERRLEARGLFDDSRSNRQQLAACVAFAAGRADKLQECYVQATKQSGTKSRAPKKTRRARSLPEDVQELEVRSPFPEEQELQARSPSLSDDLQGIQRALVMCTQAPGAKVHECRAEAERRKAMAMENAQKDKNKDKQSTAKNQAPKRARYARSLPEDVQEIEARSPFYELDEIDD